MRASSKTGSLSSGRPRGGHLAGQSSGSQVVIRPIRALTAAHYVRSLLGVGRGTEGALELSGDPQRRFSEMFGKIAVCMTLLVGACTSANSIETSSTDQQTPTSTTNVVPATSVSTQPSSTTALDSQNVISETLNLAEGTGQSVTFEFQAPVPITNTFDVEIEMPIGTELDIKFMTENGMTLQIFDPLKAEKSCLDGDGLTECLLNYPALEAPTPGTWTASVEKLSTPPAHVTVTIEWIPED